MDNRIAPTNPFKKSEIDKKKDLDKMGPKLLNSFFLEVYCKIFQ